jgi:hypothetical protein
MLTLCIWAVLATSQAQAQSVVVTMKSYDSLKDTLAYVAKLLGEEERFQQFEGLVESVTGDKDLGKVGFDTKRALGAYVVGVPQPGQPPKFVGFIPVTKEKEFVELLRKLIAVAGLDVQEGSEKGWYKMTTPGPTIHLRFVNNYVYIADSDANLNGTLPNPDNFLPATNKNNLFAATARLDQLPKELKQQALKELDKHIEMESKKKSHETDAQFEFRVAATKMLRELAGMFIEESQEASLSFNIDQKENNIRWDLALAPKPDSKLAGRVRSFTATQGVAPVHFEISFAKMAMLFASEGEQNKKMDAARKALQEAGKDGTGSVRISFQGGDALHLRLDVSTFLIKAGAPFLPLPGRD